MKQVSENPAKNRETQSTGLVIVTALLVTLYLTSNVMATKIISIGNISIFDAGTITFPLTYMLGDVLTEIWGFKTAKKVIWLTFLCNTLFMAFTALALILPSPDYLQETANAYAVIFGYVPRIVAASLLGFLAGELTNAWVLVKIKAITGNRHLWIRTIGSSAVGHLLDTVLFVLVAFTGTAPAFDLFTMILIQYFAKLLIEALGGTPLAYGAIAWICKRRNS
ncbi:MAG: queuosine precursor transporter [Clostridia bacterium]|nr:queuosine precursor transporter [Clostridia bacterium]